MSLDNPATESSGSLDANQAAEAFNNFFNAPEPEKEEAQAVDTELDAQPVEEAQAHEKAEAPAEEQQSITVKVDGKDVVLTPEQIAEAYKGQLRQEDYTRKTMQAAEARKAAEAESSKAQQERQAYAAQLTQNAQLLQAVIAEQSQMDWNALLKSDPVAYLEQKHLYDQRQATLQQMQQQYQVLAEQDKQERAKAYQAYMQQQQQELAAKLPAWADKAKAQAEITALKSYLKGEGYDDDAIGSISDHRAVILARKAMLYDQMVSKASAAAKKVATLPPKVERPGSSESNSTDHRTAAYQKFSKTGKVEDAVGAFSAFFSKR